MAVPLEREAGEQVLARTLRETKLDASSLRA